MHSRHEEDASAPLRETEGQGIDDPIRPFVAKGFDVPYQAFHRRALVEVQHEIDVLDREGRAAEPEQLEQVSDIARLGAVEARFITCHAEILARKSGGHDGRPDREAIQVAHVADHRNSGKSRPQNLATKFVLVREQGGSEIRCLKSKLKAAYASVESDQRHRALLADDLARASAHGANGVKRIVLYSNDQTYDLDVSSIEADIAALHERCGVYTKPSIAATILDEIGWFEAADLSQQRLLEPAAGDGVFLCEAARRLLSSFDRNGHPAGVAQLAPRIQAFELHAGEGEIARRRVMSLLATHGLSLSDASQIAEQWLVVGDFLLHELPSGSFTHVAGNPPYARWSKIPAALRAAYEAKLPKAIAKGDIFLPFLDRGIEALKSGGRMGFLCSDRWQYMAFAANFRSERLPTIRILKNEEVLAEDSYQRAVDIYPSILVLEKLAEPRVTTYQEVGHSLEDMGFDIRVGPALGCTPAYVLSPEDAAQVEPELLAPWLNCADLREGAIKGVRLKVICLYDDEGCLRDLKAYPKTYAWLSKYRTRLEARSIVRTHKAVWYRPIDRVYAKVWSAPKLLIPELSKSPVAMFDTSGAIPSHGIYAILAKEPGADLAALNRRLSGVGLRNMLAGRAPKVKGEYWRCYKSILKELRF